MNRRMYVLLGATLGGAAVGALATLFLPGHGSKEPAAFFTHPPVRWLAIDESMRGHWPFLIACILGWVLFSLYWEIAAKNAAPAKSSESRVSRAIHVTLVNLALLIEIAPVRGFGRYVPASPIVMMAGVAVEAVGLFLAIWARRHLGRNWSGEITIKVEHQLIRSGPYRLLRHPIYTGLLAMYAGPAIVTGEWHALLGFGMAAVAYWRKIRLEERNLEVAFGADYDAYRRDTWALVPGLY
ncbi:MAG TPA: isoprenylcysteine carboxylmethyltransferase family protein [Bryobacteraceae bacterium]|nr:isoprenylcysteine carboxylmethyltransferase family protein [Bryobacteraceae bacterium]